MPTNRTPINRRAARRITPEAIDAWKRADFMALHRALGLMPWQPSPLPREIDALGINEDDLSAVDADEARDRGWSKALALQKQLLKLAGWPNCRQQYEENLREAEEDAAYCRERVEHPPAGEYGTGCDPESRRERLEKAIAEVEYRKELLKELEAVRAKWTPIP
jgi:hypothetical protein